MPAMSNAKKGAGPCWLGLALRQAGQGSASGVRPQWGSGCLDVRSPVVGLCAGFLAGNCARHSAGTWPRTPHHLATASLFPAAAAAKQTVRPTYSPPNCRAGIGFQAFVPLYPRYTTEKETKCIRSTR